MTYLGIETSCDDTAVALVKNNGVVLDSRRWTRDEHHIPFGGIIPERASRNHLELLTPMIDQLLIDHSVKGSDLAGISVTSRPGLLGSLIVGTVTAKTLSLSWSVPFIGVNHLEGHVFSAWLSDSQPVDLVFPHLSLIVSGGHTHLVLIEALGSYRVLGKTRDDAAGEALDKFSNLIGMGFPGGPKIDALAKKGDPKAYEFPRPMLREKNYDFSFSGLKAAAARLLKDKNTLLDEQVKADMAASYQSAVVEVLVEKTRRALKETGAKVFTLVGGVSANSQLRAEIYQLGDELGVEVKIPELKYCTDNAAMIAYAGALRIQRGELGELDLKPRARSLAGDFID